MSNRSSNVAFATNVPTAVISWCGLITRIMSEHAKAAMLENIEQNLIELMAEYLDSESLQLDQAIALVKDPVPREESELHIRMAKAAFLEYKKTIVDANGSSTCH